MDVSVDGSLAGGISGRGYLVNARFSSEQSPTPRLYLSVVLSIRSSSFVVPLPPTSYLQLG